MSDTELRDQLMTLLLAGHETTATALAWTFDLLLRHAPALQRLRDSLEAGEDDYLRATISESLRLRPVVPLAGRRLAKELSVDGLTLPAGHRRHARRSGSPTPAPTSTPSPSPSGPSASSRTAPDTYAWIPFGGGIRRCLGAAFAEFEMRIVLREVLTRCDLHKASPAPERTGRRNITLSPATAPRSSSPRAARRANRCSPPPSPSSRRRGTAGAPWPSGRSRRSRRSPRRRRGRGSAPRWCRSAS